MLPTGPTILHQRKVEVVVVVCKINLSIEHWKGYLLVGEGVWGAEAGAGVVVEEEEEGIGNFVAYDVENFRFHETVPEYE